MAWSGQATVLRAINFIAMYRQAKAMATSRAARLAMNRATLPATTRKDWVSDR